METNNAPTIAWQLFHRVYRIEMKNKFRYHREQLTRIPNFESWDSEQKHGFLEDYVQMAKTPIAMVLLHNQGIPFNILYAEDLFAIHTLFKNHFQRWEDIRNDQLSNRKPPPDSDFIIMQNFVSTIAHTAENIRKARVTKHTVVDQHTTLDEFEKMFGGGFGMRFEAVTPVVSRFDDQGHSANTSGVNDTWSMIENGNI